MKIFGLSILGLIEIRWTEQGKLLSEGVMALYSGREDDNYWESTALLFRKEAAKALKEWESVESGILTACFVMNRATQCYVPTGNSNEQTISMQDCRASLEDQ